MSPAAARSASRGRYSCCCRRRAFPAPSSRDGQHLAAVAAEDATHQRVALGGGGGGAGAGGRSDKFPQSVHRPDSSTQRVDSRAHIRSRRTGRSPPCHGFCWPTKCRCVGSSPAASSSPWPCWWCDQPARRTCRAHWRTAPTNSGRSGWHSLTWPGCTSRRWFFWPRRSPETSSPGTRAGWVSSSGAEAGLGWKTQLGPQSQRSRRRRICEEVGGWWGGRDSNPRHDGSSIALSTRRHVCWPRATWTSSCSSGGSARPAWSRSYRTYRHFAAGSLDVLRTAGARRSERFTGPPTSRSLCQVVPGHGGRRRSGRHAGRAPERGYSFAKPGLTPMQRFGTVGTSKSSRPRESGEAWTSMSTSSTTGDRCCAWLICSRATYIMPRTSSSRNCSASASPYCRDHRVVSDLPDRHLDPISNWSRPDPSSKRRLGLRGETFGEWLGAQAVGDDAE